MNFSLGQRIRELRRQRRISQIELAKGICTPSMISQIETDRARPSYKTLSALAERLEVTIEQLLTDTDLDQEYMSLYKRARAMVAAKDYASAKPILLQVLDTPRAQISSFEIMVVLAECHLHTDQPEEAEKLLSQTLDMAHQKQDLLNIITIYKHLGELNLRRKRYQLAVHHFSKALQEIEKQEHPDPFLKNSILFLLGQTFAKRGQFSEALSYYQQIKGYSSLVDLGRESLQLADTSPGYADRAAAIYEMIDTLLDHARLQAAQAVLLSEFNHEEALRLIENAIARFAELQAHKEEAQALCELSKLLCKENRLEQALSACERANSILPADNPFHAHLHQQRGNVAFLQDKFEESLHFYTLAANLFKNQGELAEWDDTMHAIANVHATQNNYQQAFLVADSAYQYLRRTISERGISL